MARTIAGRLAILGLALMLTVSLAAPAHAHKLKVFATAVGAEIDGSVYFVGGGPAPGASVSIETNDGAPLAKLQANPEGKFSFVATVRADHRIHVDTGDGHSAEITIAADDLPASLPSPAAPTAPPITLVPNAAAAPTSPVVAAMPVAGEGTAIEDLVAKAVAQQIRPLREQINAYEDQVRLRDITGGIGYIVGLAGLTLWLRSRHRERAP